MDCKQLSGYEFALCCINVESKCAGARQFIELYYFI